MEAIRDFDDDGFELQFEEDTTKEERDFFVSKYYNVNLVADDHTHCTCCNMHIGTAPANEKTIRMHPILRVTQCIKCFRFYNSGEFDKGEDGSELYCRWCGQGGEVFCCATCPYVFCQKCILRNLSRTGLNEVLANDNWRCYKCVPQPIYKLRAQHWALTNFIAKQLKKLESKRKAGSDPDAYTDAIRKDVSTCCISRPRAASGKRRRYVSDPVSSDSDDNIWPLQKKTKNKANDTAKKSPKEAEIPAEKESISKVAPAQAKITPKPAAANAAATSTAKSTPTAAPTATATKTTTTATSAQASSKKSVDATPDLFSYLLGHSLGESSNTTGPPAAAPQQPPTIRPLQRPAAAKMQPRQLRPAHQQRPAQNEAPIYHNYHGERIDLVAASTRSTMHLPSGRVIHVRRQSAFPNQPRPQIPMQSAPQYRVRGPSMTAQQITSTIRAMAPRPPILRQPTHQQYRGLPQLAPMSVRQPQPMTQPGAIQRIRQSLQQRTTQPQQQPQQQPQMHPQQMAANARPSTSNAPATPSVVPRNYPNTIIGRAQGQLQLQIFSAMEICHQIDGKLKTLMNSNAYKSSSKKTDIKELYIHLSYLFTYTTGRFNTLQEKCMEDMRQMGFKKDAGTLSSGNVIEKYGSDIENDEEIEIVEPNHATINLDSDEERTPKKKTPIKNNDSPAIIQPSLPATMQQATNSNPLPSKSAASANAKEPETEQEDVIREGDTVANQSGEEASENVEIAVDISAILGLENDEDENLNEDEESLLVRMYDEVEEIATPPSHEEENSSNDALLADAQNPSIAEQSDKTEEQSTFVVNDGESSAESIKSDSNDVQPKSETKESEQVKKKTDATFVDFYENDVISVDSDDDSDTNKNTQKYESVKSGANKGDGLSSANKSNEEENKERAEPKQAGKAEEEANRNEASSVSETSAEKNVKDIRPSSANKSNEEENEERAEPNPTSKAEEEANGKEASSVSETSAEENVKDNRPSSASKSNEEENEERAEPNPASRAEEDANGKEVSETSVEENVKDNRPSSANKSNEDENKENAEPSPASKGSEGEDAEDEELLVISHIEEHAEQVDVNNESNDDIFIDTSAFLELDQCNDDDIQIDGTLDSENASECGMDIENPLEEIKGISEQAEATDELTTECATVDLSSESGDPLESISAENGVDGDTSMAMGLKFDITAGVDADGDMTVDIAIGRTIRAGERLDGTVAVDIGIGGFAESTPEDDDLINNLDQIIQEASNALATDHEHSAATNNEQQQSLPIPDQGLIVSTEELENISSPDTFTDYAKNGETDSEFMDTLADLMPDSLVPNPE